MATYIIGDVQGCLSSLQKLLEQINYNPATDQLGFVGDLVNRGPDSLATLRFIKNLHNPYIVLGNHDLHLLALGYGCETLTSETDKQCLGPILQAPDHYELLDWLRQQQILLPLESFNAVITHAGIPPQWSIEQAQDYANEMTQCLCGPDFKDYLTHMYGNQPTAWSNDLTDYDRFRYLVNAFTRMRFCSQSGELDLQNKTIVSDQPNYKPWFEWRHDSVDVLFGHWAALEGKTNKPGYYALDTGCVWGNRLTALRLEDRELLSVVSVGAKVAIPSMMGIIIYIFLLY